MPLRTRVRRGKWGDHHPSSLPPSRALSPSPAAPPAQPGAAPEETGPAAVFYLSRLVRHLPLGPVLGAGHTPRRPWRALLLLHPTTRTSLLPAPWIPGGLLGAARAHGCSGTPPRHPPPVPEEGAAAYVKQRAGPAVEGPAQGWRRGRDTPARRGREEPSPPPGVGAAATSALERPRAGSRRGPPFRPAPGRTRRCPMLLRARPAPAPAAAAASPPR